MERRSVVELAKYAAMVLPLVGAAATVVVFAEETKSALADIRKEQAEIRRTQANIVHAVEKGNDRIVDAVSRGSLALAVELGRVSERTEAD